MTRKSLRFESFTLDLERLCLHGPSGRADLRRKSFEVLRYLVEHAGRVVTKEEVMRAIWSGVTVSDESLAQCIRDVRRALGDEAQRIVKTVPRRGYLLNVPISEGAALPVETTAAAAGGALPFPLPDRPSIAVLAFTNMSGDRGQDYFCDGMTEDIITELSRFSDLFVIARNSTFAYKGKAVDVRQVGRELGVHYVLEGSIRREGDRVRISAQLIDAVTGVHRWAERYDRNIEDVFALQDEVARTIVALLAAHVNKAEAGRTQTKPPATWEAYDYYIRAADTLSSFWPSFDVEELYKTRRLLERSLSLDPAYARAYSLLSNTYVIAWGMGGLDGDYLRPAVLARAHELARKAVRLDPNLPEARTYLGLTLLWKRRPDAAVAEFEKAIALNPNFTDVRFAMALIYAGEPGRAIEAIKAHMRLDPFYVATTPGWLGLAYYMLERYSEAIPTLRECVSRAPNFRGAHVWLAAACAQSGLLDEARGHVAEVLRIEPNYTIEGTATHMNVFKNAHDSEHYFDGLRKAGLPEK